jgi:hypothetical protein
MKTLRALIFRMVIFSFLFALTSFSGEWLQGTDSANVVVATYTLPNNLPYQYSSIMSALPAQTSDIKASFKSADARSEILRQYLEKYKSPLEPFADLIVRLADENDFDYRWLVAIAQQESNLCKRIPEKSFNCWGWGIYPDPSNPGTLKVTRFKSYEDALVRIAPQFKRIFIGDASHKDPHKVMKTYTPPSDGSWAAGVNQFFSELE